MQLFLTVKKIIIIIIACKCVQSHPILQQVCGNQKTASGVTSPTPILVLMGYGDWVQDLRLVQQPPFSAVPFYLLNSSLIQSIKVETKSPEECLKTEPLPFDL